MDECGRREDYALDSVSFNAFRYVPRLLEGFVGFPEPFLVEELNPLFQRLRLVNGPRRRIQEPYANYPERTLSEEPLPLRQLLLVIGKYVELNCIRRYPAEDLAVPGAGTVPPASPVLIQFCSTRSWWAGPIKP